MDDGEADLMLLDVGDFGGVLLGLLVLAAIQGLHEARDKTISDERCAVSDCEVGEEKRRDDRGQRTAEGSMGGERRGGDANDINREWRRGEVRARGVWTRVCRVPPGAGARRSRVYFAFLKKGIFGS